jgi:protein-S-isoprenylcysteine O-methyltransferase Ste14
VTRNPHYWLHLAGFAWAVFLFYWLVSAERLKKVKQREAYGVLALGEFRGLISCAIAIASFYLTARKEAHFLTQEFGETFNDHVRRKGMFLPSLGGHR